MLNKSSSTRGLWPESEVKRILFDLDALQWTPADFFWNQSLSEDVLQLHHHMPALPNWPLTKKAVHIHSVQTEQGDIYDELRWSQDFGRPGYGRHEGWGSLTVPIRPTEPSGIQAINGTLHVAVAARVSRHTFGFGPSAPRVRVKIGEQTAYFLLAEPDFVVGRWPLELQERCTLVTFDDRGERIEEGQWFSFGEDEVFYAQRFERPVISLAVLEGHDYIERQIEFSAKHRASD